MNAPRPMEFFSKLDWLDGRPLSRVIESYRARIFEEALFTFDGDGRPTHNLVLCGRAKKNWKSADLVLAGFYRLVAWPSLHGNDGFVLANDEDQAGDDLSIARKLVQANPVLGRVLDCRAKEITRMDGRGALKILPAKDVAGAHGKTYLFCGFDEIHAYRNHDLFEALAPDPTRPDALTWVTSYASIFNAEGAPLHDLMKRGKAGDDPRMYFSWYAADYSTDADAGPTPEVRANPSMGSWEDPGYLDQQRRRLPAHKYRRLHLNLPGAPTGAFLDGDRIAACVVRGRRGLPPRDHGYVAFVDMSGGSSDEAALAIAHLENEIAVLDLVETQAGKPPFDPRDAVRKFAGLLGRYGISRVVGDHYAGETFRRDFEDQGIVYDACALPKHRLYEELEPRINARAVELLDLPELTAQLGTLVWRGAKVDHQPGDRDDRANAAAGAIWLAADGAALPIRDEDYDLGMRREVFDAANSPWQGMRDVQDDPWSSARGSAFEGGHPWN